MINNTVTTQKPGTIIPSWMDKWEAGCKDIKWDAWLFWRLKETHVLYNKQWYHCREWQKSKCTWILFGYICLKSYIMFKIFFSFYLRCIILLFCFNDLLCSQYNTFKLCWIEHILVINFDFFRINSTAGPYFNIYSVKHVRT